MARAVVVLPLPEFAHQRQRLPAGDGEADAPYGGHAPRLSASHALADAAATLERDTQVFHDQERLGSRGLAHGDLRGRWRHHAQAAPPTPALPPAPAAKCVADAARKACQRAGSGAARQFAWLGRGQCRRPRLHRTALGAREEVGQHAHVAVGLLVVRHVAGLLEDDPLRLRDALGHEGHLCRRGLVVSATGDERGDLDVTESCADVPVAQGAHDVELGGPVHGAIDLRVAGRLGVRPRHRLGVRHHPAEVSLVEDLDGRLILGIIPGTRRLVTLQHLDDLGRQGGSLLTQSRRSRGACSLANWRSCLRPRRQACARGTP